MKEKEYLMVINLTNVNRALDAVRDMLPGDDYGIDRLEREKIIATLVRWQMKMHKELNKKVKES